MNLTRRHFIKGLAAVAAALGLGLPKAKAQSSESCSSCNSSEATAGWELVGPNGEPMSTSSTGSMISTRSGSPDDMCTNCIYDNCLDYCLKDDLDGDCLTQMSEQMAVAARQETEREFETWKFQSEVTTVGALNIDAWGEEPLGGLKWCESPPVYILQPDGTIERMEG